MCIFAWKLVTASQVRPINRDEGGVKGQGGEKNIIKHLFSEKRGKRRIFFKEADMTS